MGDSKRDADVQNRLLDSVGEGEGGMIWENGIETCIISNLLNLNSKFSTYWLSLFSEVTQSCLTLCVPMDCSLPGFSIPGIFQARVLEWVTISFFRGSPWPRDWTQVSCIAGRCFTLWATREALHLRPDIDSSASHPIHWRKSLLIDWECHAQLNLLSYSDLDVHTTCIVLMIIFFMSLTTWS